MLFWDDICLRGSTGSGRKKVLVGNEEPLLAPVTSSHPVPFWKKMNRMEMTGGKFMDLWDFGLSQGSGCKGITWLLYAFLQALPSRFM